MLGSRPAMSWDVIIIKTTDPNFARPTEKADRVLMGKPDEVRSSLDKSIRGIHWTSTSHGVLNEGSLTLEFLLSAPHNSVDGLPPVSLKASDEVDSIGVYARGSGNPVEIIVKAAKFNQWSVFDSGMGTWIDLNSPNQQSWKEYTYYASTVEPETPGKTEGGAANLGTHLLLSVVVFAAVIVFIR